MSKLGAPEAQRKNRMKSISVAIDYERKTNVGSNNVWDLNGPSKWFIWICRKLMN